MDRAAWLAERKTGIGSSDSASVFNVGYGCRRRLTYDKRNIEPDFPEDKTLAMGLGNILEPFFADEYARKTGYALSESASRQHPVHPEARVNPDRLIIVPPGVTGPAGTGVLEIKAQSRGTYLLTKRDGLNEQYIVQEQHAIWVTGTEWGAFQIGNRDSGESMSWQVEKSDVIQQELEKEVPAIWKLIQSDAPLPDRLEIDDPRCSRCPWRVQCQGNALVYAQGPSDLVPAEELRPLIAEYDVRKPLCDEAEELLTEIQLEIKTALENKPAAYLPGEKVRKVYYRSQPGRTSWKTEDLMQKYVAMRSDLWSRTGESEHAALTEKFPPVDEFRRQGLPFRTLRIY